MAVSVRINLLARAVVDLAVWRHEAVARPYWRLYHNAAPGWGVAWRGGVHDLRPDRVVVVAPETVFHGRWNGPARHAFLHLTCEGAEVYARPGIWSLALDPALDALRAAWATGVHRDLAAQAFALASLARLPAEALDRPDHGPVVTRALQLLAEADAAVPVADLAAVAGMHPTAFIRRFRQETGTTPHRWHLARRIAAACLDLEDPTLDMETIAQRHGFCDRHHFSRVFRAFRGMGPATYRREGRSP